MSARITNWAGNVEFAASALHRPDSVEALQEVVAGSSRLRVLGTGHSFNRIADTTGDLVSVADLPTRLELDPDASTVTVSGGTRYAELAAYVAEHGLALHNLGSLPHISVAGACATGTHGSGVGNRVLGAAVRGIELVRADGELVRIGADDPDLPGAVVSLGALGVVTALTLAVEPVYDVQQLVVDDVPHDALLEHLPEAMASAYSVSAFSDWRDPVRWQLWRKHRVDDGGPIEPSPYLGGRPADGPRHPVPGVDPVHCTQQLGVAGPWHERLPHFRREFTPSSGEELQSEFMVPFEHAGAALQALAALRERVAPLLMICELRSIAADDLWLSTAQGRDSFALHFTWVRDEAAVAPVVASIEAALAPFGARPHWGKVFSVDPGTLRTLYPRWDDFAGLLAAYDPAGTVRGDLVSRFFPV